jgi:hypothetical protein
MCCRLLILISIFISACTHPVDQVIKEKESLGEHIDEGWMSLSPDLWASPISKSFFDPSQFTVSTTEEAHIKSSGKIEGMRLFSVDPEFAPAQHKLWIDITQDCSQLLEEDYLLTLATWTSSEKSRKYYRDIDRLIENVVEKLGKNFAISFEQGEKELFARALKTLAWQESGWLHYYTFDGKLLLFIGLSGYNSLGDWGITQIARSAHKKNQRLNETFFNTKAYCSVFSSLYYGFAEYIYAYQDSRQMECNSDSFIDRIIGAYNRYVSGFSACHDRFSKTNPQFGDFQKTVLNNFRHTFEEQPWLEKTYQ